MRLRLLALTALVVSAFMLVPLAAQALGPTYKSVTTIRATNPVFHGRVHLRHAGKHPGIAHQCRTHRRVTLFRKVPGGGKFQKAGRTRTNRRGHWTIRQSPLTNGTYFAVAKRRVLPKKGDKICGRDASRRIQIG